MASTWYRSKLFRLAAIVVGLMVVVLLVAPYLLDLDRYRTTIVEQLKAKTGRDIEIEKLRLRLLPSLGVEVVNFQVKNPTGFPEGNTLAVERVDVGLALMPLLRRQIEVTGVTVSKPQLNLLANERGQTNYEMPQEPKPAARGKKAPAAEEAPLALGRIDTVAIEEASVTLGSFWQRDKRVHPGWTVSGINVRVRGIDLNDPQWLRQVAAQMDLSTIEITGPSLKQPLRFTDGSVEAKNNAANGDFTLALGELRAKGTVKVVDLGNPVADFTLAMKDLNVAQVNAVMGPGAKGAPGPRAATGGRPQLVAQGTVRVDKLVVPPLTAQKVQGKVRVYSTRLEVDPFSLELYSGRTRGSMGVDLTQDSLPTWVNAKVEGVNVAQAVAALSPSAKGKLTGQFESDARLGLALGASNPLAGLGGGGTFAVRDGTFPGLNLEGTLAKMAKLMQMNVPSGDTRFRSFGGDFRIADQRVHSNSLHLDAETLDASLQGSFGFDQTLNYTGSGMLTGKGGTQQQQQSSNPLGGLRRVFGGVMQQTFGRMRVPFTVRGTFQQPQFILAGAPQAVPAR